MPYDQSVRTMMNNAGYDNSKIGYDGNSGFVTYNNQPFMKPQMNVNGTTYSDQATFDQAHNQYQQQNPQSTDTAQSNPYQGAIFHPQDENLPYAQRLINYATNPQAGQAELQRSQTAYNIYHAMGDTSSADSAQAHINRVMAALGPNAQQAQTPYDKQTGDLVSAVMQRLNTPSQYDVYNSPEYKAAQAAEAYQAQQATRQAQESMGEAGFGRSTNLMDRSQMIQNDANQRLLAQVAPALIQQHNAMDQQKTANMMGMLSPLLQQQQMSMENQHWNKSYQLQQNADQRAGQAQQFNQGIAQAGLTGTYNGQQTLEGQKQALDQMQTMATLTGKMPDGTPTNAAQQQQLANEWKAAETTGVITPTLAQLYGIPEGTPTLQAKQIAAELAYKNASLGIEGARIGIEAQNAANQANYQRGMLNNESNRINWEKDPNNPMNQYHTSLSNYRDTGAANQVDKAYQDAVQLAQKDPAFLTAMNNPDMQNQIIENYYSRLKKQMHAQGSNQPGQPAVSDADIQQYLK